MTDTFARLTAALADRYTIVRELGAGGRATVYLAEDLKHGMAFKALAARPRGLTTDRHCPGALMA